MDKKKTSKTKVNNKEWMAKLHDKKDLPRIEKLTAKAAKRWLAGRSFSEGRGRGTIVIPAPTEVDEVMRQVPKGKVITMTEIRDAMARKHKATIGCPSTCGIFANIAARAAEQERAEGKRYLVENYQKISGAKSLKESFQLAPRSYNIFVLGDYIYVPYGSDDSCQ
ncbi:MAG: hypothetical protein FJ044_03945 [Candidatus Cloacimonetes bacterium]|nr:hypothetical protein [Candidatus Cloacimonadota bacterium]